MFCAIPEGTMRQEQEYFKALQTVTKYHILDNEQTLQLLYSNSKNNLLFLKKKRVSKKHSLDQTPHPIHTNWTYTIFVRLPF